MSIVNIIMYFSTRQTDLFRQCQVLITQGHFFLVLNYHN